MTHGARRARRFPRHGEVQVYGTTVRDFDGIMSFGQVTGGRTRFDHVDSGNQVQVTAHRTPSVLQMPMSCITEEFRNSRSSAPITFWISGLSRKMNRPRSQTVLPSKDMVMSIR